MRKVTPKKKYGQNFLKDEGILSAIVDAAEVSSDDIVFEIGPGTGNLTKKLCERAKAVTAIEIDTDLIPYLTVATEKYDNITIRNADIMETSLSELLPDGRIKVVANLPYYITTPIITKLLEERDRIESLTLMVQKEVAERMAAPCGSKECGAVSYFVSWNCIPEMIMTVPAAAFYPAPKVDSAVIRLLMRREPYKTGVDEKALFSIIKAAFSMRRKTLANALSADPEVSGGRSKEEIKTLIESLGLDGNIRGERLTMDDYLNIQEILSNEF